MQTPTSQAPASEDRGLAGWHESSYELHSGLTVMEAVDEAAGLALFWQWSQALAASIRPSVH